MNMMKIENSPNRYQGCIDASKRVRWDIEDDVIRGRQFSMAEKFLPDGLTQVGKATCLSADEQRLVSQIQGRTYANIFGLVERFINAKVLELSHDHCFDDQVALEALIRFSDEEIKHQALFRRVEGMCADVMPAGFTFEWNPNDVAGLVLGKSTWAVLALTLYIELFTQSHYRESIDGDGSVSDVYRDIFKFHWMEESQHAIIDELEFRRIDATTSTAERDTGVDEFIELVGAIDGILQGQAKADTAYFMRAAGRDVSTEDETAINDMMLGAYRWQYILSGAEHKRFQKVMGELVTPAQITRIGEALDTLQ